MGDVAMERITKTFGEAAVCMLCENCPLYEKQLECTQEDCNGIAMQRLAEYESTGLTPPEIETIKELATPFSNDPFTLVQIAFRNMYPEKNFEAHWHPGIGEEDSEDGKAAYGVTIFTEGKWPIVLMNPALDVANAVEVFAHELAHVAAGADSGHGEEWEAAFDAIFQEYGKVCEKMLSYPEEQITSGQTEKQEN